MSSSTSIDDDPVSFTSVSPRGRFSGLNELP
jgi:hypothetical protein